jgi:hypothetical protein
MFRLGASLVVVATIALSWFLFGNQQGEQSSTQEQQSSPQPSADDEALRKSLGQ